LCQTLALTCVASGWTELRALPKKVQRWVHAALARFDGRTPSPSLAWTPGAGPSSQGDQLYRYCVEQGIAFTRGRLTGRTILLIEHFMEQKNWSVDASGRPAGNVIEETPGAPCAPSATFLRYRDTVFVRAPHGEIPPLEGAPPYDGAARLPRDAVYTGYHDGPRQLWISPSDRGLAIYIVVGDRVERWPAAGAACA